jgi:4-amino-4-deoxy-L-arabinose transferase-like glycosyltransferase
LIRRHDAGAFVALTVLGALLRFSTLGVQSFDRDEAITAGHVLHPSLFDTLRSVLGETNPPLFYLLDWVSLTLFGAGEVSLRLVSAVAGTATVPVAYELGRTIVSRRVGLILGALVAVNPLLLWFSQEARPYALMILFTALSFLFFAKALDDPSRRNLGWWVVASAVAFASHYFAIFLIAAEAAVLLLSTKDRRATWRAVGVTAAAVVVLMPLLVYQAIHGGAAWIGGVDLGSRLQGTGRSWAAGITEWGVDDAGLVVTILAGVGVALVAFLGDSRERRGALLGLLGGASAGALPVVPALWGNDYLIDRNVVAALIPFALVVAAGFGARRARWGGLAGALALFVTWGWLAVVLSTDARYQRPGWRSAAKALGTPSGPRVIVAPFNGDYSLEIYLSRWRRMVESATRVDEVVVFSWIGARPAPPPGFRVSGRRSFPQFQMVRYRAPRPLMVSRRVLATTALGGACNPSPVGTGCERAVVFLDGPG